jgi:hypothetical protein
MEPYSAFTDSDVVDPVEPVMVQTYYNHLCSRKELLTHLNTWRIRLNKHK